ncbi:hypothetical protein MMC13_002725 [Lambiella insularis]|nr:hypothetical protein [Lambiella insularis]
MASSSGIWAAEQANFRAARAHGSGTYAEAAVLLDGTGVTWWALENCVMQDNIIADITAHAVRQLISWYLKQKLAKVPMPMPWEMTIVTNVDPCMMCAGALLESGINVCVVSYDIEAGINWERNQTFLPVPEALRLKAHSQFSYFGLDNGLRMWAGSSSSIFSNGYIPTSIDARSTAMVAECAQRITQKIKDQDPAPYNIWDLGANSPQLNLLQQRYAPAGRQLIDLTIPDHRRKLRIAMEHMANETARRPTVRNSAALIDPFNNVLLIMGYGRGPSINTPFMRLMSAYTSCRREASGATDGALPHTKHCTIVLLNGFGRGPTDVMDLGLYGLPATHPRALYYYHAQQTSEELAAMIAALPPLYRTTIKSTPAQLEGGSWLLQLA